MARDFNKNNKNVLTIFDVPSQTNISFSYCIPSSRERIQYKSAITTAALGKSEDSKRLEKLLQLQSEWALKFITGFTPGSFSVDGVLICSDPNEAVAGEGVEKEIMYDPDWKQLLEEEASDLLLTFATTILGEPNYLVKNPLPPFSGN